MLSNKITVTYGSDPFEMALRLLEAENIAEVIPKGALIGLKPNLVTASPASSGATTHPEISAAIIEYLQAHGHSNIIILEGSWVGADTTQAFRTCGYDDVARKYGAKLVDLQKDTHKTLTYEGFSVDVCSKALEVDYLINLPVLKGHGQTGLTCALKNMKGCITNSEKRRFHTVGLHKPIAVLNKLIHGDLVIVDGLNGDLNFEEGGNPVRMDRMFMGTDPVLIDSYCANLIGFEKDEIAHLVYAERLGVGSGNLSKAEIIELNEPVRENTRHNNSYRVKSLARYIDERSACSACYAGLLNALDKLESNGELRRITQKFCIGQDFIGRTGAGIGCGKCTSGLDNYIPGCPVRAIDVAEFVRSMKK